MGNHLVPARTDEFVANEIFNRFSFPALSYLQDVALGLGKKHGDTAIGNAISGVLWELRQNERPAHEWALIAYPSTGKELAGLHLTIAAFDDVIKGISFVLLTAVGKLAPDGCGIKTVQACQDFALHVCQLHKFAPEYFKDSNAEREVARRVSIPQPWLWERLYRKPHENMMEAAKCMLENMPVPARADLRGLILSVVSKEAPRGMSEQIMREVLKAGPCNASSSAALRRFVKDTPIADWRLVVDAMRLSLEGKVVLRKKTRAETEGQTTSRAARLGTMLTRKLYALHPQA